MNSYQHLWRVLCFGAVGNFRLGPWATGVKMSASIDGYYGSIFGLAYLDL